MAAAMSKCDSLLTALWEGHSLEVATVRSPTPLEVVCVTCGKKMRRRTARVIGCLDCNVGLEMGDNFCKMCASSKV